MKTFSHSVLVLLLAVAFLGGVLLTLAQAPAAAQQTAKPEQSLRPIASLLHADGSLTCTRGSAAASIRAVGAW